MTKTKFYDEPQPIDYYERPATTKALELRELREKQARRRSLQGLVDRTEQMIVEVRYLELGKGSQQAIAERLDQLHEELLSNS